MKNNFKIVIIIGILVALIGLTSAAFAYSWSQPRWIGWGGQQDAYPQAVGDADGKLYVIWNTHYWPRNIYSNIFDGINWSDVKRVNQTTTSNYSPDITTDHNGHAHAVWWGYLASTGSGIYYSFFEILQADCSICPQGLCN